MNPILVFASLLLVAPASVVVADAVDVDCFGPPCDQINAVCRLVGGNNCLGMAPVEPDCAGLPCDLVNVACNAATKHDCVAMEATDDCMGSACDAINRACGRLGGSSCVGATDGDDDMVQCLAVESWYRDCRTAVGAAGAACDVALGKDCLDAPVAAAPVDCVGLPCDAINAVCHAGNKYLPDPCVK